MLKIKYNYSVTYKYPNGDGRMFITRNKPIKTFKDIEELDQYIRDFHKNKQKFEPTEMQIPRSAVDKIYVVTYKLVNKQLTFGGK